MANVTAHTPPRPGRLRARRPTAHRSPRPSRRRACLRSRAAPRRGPPYLRSGGAFVRNATACHAPVSRSLAWHATFANLTSPGPITTIRARTRATGRVGSTRAETVERPPPPWRRDAAEERLEDLRRRRRRDGAEERVAGGRLPRLHGSAQPSFEPDMHLARGRLRVEPADDAPAARAGEEVGRGAARRDDHPGAGHRGCTAGCRGTRSSLRPRAPSRPRGRARATRARPKAFTASS